jgi:hypothetical protein
VLLFTAARRRVEAWRVATEALWRHMEAVVPLRTLQNLVLTVGALAFLGQPPPTQADANEEPDPQATDG